MVASPVAPLRLQLWAAKGEADIRPVVYTARLSGEGTFNLIFKTIGA